MVALHKEFPCNQGASVDPVMFLTFTAFGFLFPHHHHHHKQATWDTVGLFLPCDYARTKGKVEPYVDRRLKHIVTACGYGSSSSTGGGGSILDVGCGDGAVMPYLLNANMNGDASNAPNDAAAIEYKGLDVSSVMIDMAKSKYPTQDFVVGSFPEDLNDNERFDTILFNGSLQFFRDTLQTLRHARSMLTDDGATKSRIVLSHVQGNKFVKDECRTSQGVAVRNMPNKVSLEDYAKILNMRVVYKDELLSSTTENNDNNYDPTLDGDDDQFYLVALETL